jgi:hypothetical protein
VAHTLVVGSLGLGLVVPDQIDALAAGEDEIPVELGTYRFGHLTKPDAIVASVGPKGVAFEKTEEFQNSPWSFDVTADGTVYLLDQFNSRILVWDSGEPDHVARTIKLPKDQIQVAADIAVGPDGTIYLTYVRPGPKGIWASAIDQHGEVLWTTPLGNVSFNSVLRMGPDGRVYRAAGLGTDHFFPITDAAGRPLSLAEQHEQSLALQPGPDGTSLEEDALIDPSTGTAHAVRFRIHDASGAVTDAWRITNTGSASLDANDATPALIDGDPVVVVGVSGKAPPDTPPPSEIVALRLGPDGEVTRVVMDPRAVWGEGAITGIRVGQDGALYQLRTDIDTGATIARYSLAAEEPSPSPSPSPSVSPSPSASPVTPSPTAPQTIEAEGSSSTSFRWIVPIAILGGALVGLAVALILRRRRTRSGT